MPPQTQEPLDRWFLSKIYFLQKCIETNWDWIRGNLFSQFVKLNFKKIDLDRQNIFPELSCTIKCPAIYCNSNYNLFFLNGSLPSRIADQFLTSTKLAIPLRTCVMRTVLILIIVFISLLCLYYCVPFICSWLLIFT